LLCSKFGEGEIYCNSITYIINGELAGSGRMINTGLRPAYHNWRVDRALRLVQPEDEPSFVLCFGDDIIQDALEPFVVRYFNNNIVITSSKSML